MRLAAAAALLLAGPLTADDAALAKCRAITREAERLRCFDSLASPTPAPAPAPAAPSAGRNAWAFSEEKDEMTDESTPIITTMAQSGGATMALACVTFRGKPSLGILIDWRAFLGTDTTEVTHRLDDKPAATSDWGISSDGRSTSYRGDEKAFVQSLAGGQRLMVRVTPYRETSMTVTFPVTGLADVLPKLKPCF